MFSPELIRFLVSKDEKIEKKEQQSELQNNIMFRFARLATVPVELRK